MLAKHGYDTQVIVLKSAPDIPKLLAEQTKPFTRMFADVILRSSRPVLGDLATFQGMSGRSFGGRNRVFQHGRLAGTQAGWKPRVTVCRGIVADPKIDSAMSGQHYRIPRDDRIVNPAGRRAQSHS